MVIFSIFFWPILAAAVNIIALVACFSFIGVAIYVYIDNYLDKKRREKHEGYFEHLD